MLESLLPPIVEGMEVPFVELKTIHFTSDTQ